MKLSTTLFLLSAIGGFAWGATITQPAAPPISVLTAAQILASTPTYVGQPVICSNCISAYVGYPSICIATETANANNAYILAGSSLSAVTGCK